MKQHITIEQAREITKYKQVEKIYTLTKSKVFSDWAKYFTIGRMIEFLNDNGQAICIDQWINDKKGKSLQGKGWYRVGLNWFQGLNDKFDYICEEKELCDALWMATEWFLNK
jgi:hypothetical protein